MNTKERISFATCIGAFILGWGLVIADFCIPPISDVNDSTLWVLGQALLYCAGILGVTNYYNAEFSKFKNEVRSQIKH